jgi:phage shock protein E
MDWTIATIVGVAIVAFFIVKRMSFVSEEVARNHLAQGALVMDVRSPEEYRGGHAPDAINLPLGELRESLPRRVKDKNQVLLLHCLSGARSSIARGQVRRLGYPNVFNLGSFARAEKIVRSARGA